jgi:hypothetical protein
MRAQREAGFDKVAPVAPGSPTYGQLHEYRPVVGPGDGLVGDPVDTEGEPPAHRARRSCNRLGEARLVHGRQQRDARSLVPAKIESHPDGLDGHVADVGEPVGATGIE